MYTHEKFERRPLQEIMEDIESAREYYRDDTRTVFIGDSNSILINTKDFVAILEKLYASFPHIERVTSYARAGTIKKKPANHLRQLREAGLTRLHVGLETGDAELLKRIRKGVTPDDMAAAGLKAKAAGFEYSLYVLLGIGGENQWEQHAIGTANILNRIDPHFIRVRTLVPQPGCNLYEDIKQGRFEKASHKTVLREQKTLIDHLAVTSRYVSDHISNYIPVNGKLPEDKQAMLETIDEYLQSLEDDETLRRQFQKKDNLTSL
jgi:radical SAM superfamily enzyme YgiQ (UPF0313 family)